MSKFQKVLWSLFVLLILVSITTFAVGILFAAVILGGLVWLYRYYRGRRRPRTPNRPNRYFSGEIVDITADRQTDNLKIKHKPGERDY